MKSNPPPQLAKQGLKGIKNNLPEGYKVDINTSGFTTVFSEELMSFARNIEQHRRNAQR